MNRISALLQDSILRKKGYLYALYWIILFILYLPAAKAGFVKDFTGWLADLRESSFIDHINRSHFTVHSLYQFTQFCTWLLYQFVGANPWGWHLIHVSMHALNCTLLYAIVSGLCTDTGLKNGNWIAFGGTLLFCVSPYVSEVIVWESAFHFLLGLFLLLVILYQAQQFIRTGKAKHALIAGFVFLLSTFSIELFYVTPWMVLSLGFFYSLGTGRDKSTLRRIILFFVLPELLLFGVNLAVFRLMYGTWFAHIGQDVVIKQDFISYGSKPLKYLFHVLLLGRFRSHEFRAKIYAICEMKATLAIFYGAIVVCCSLILFRFRKMAPAYKTASLLFVWTCFTMGIITPLWFNDLLLVQFDRYNYFYLGFLFLLLVTLLAQIPFRKTVGVLLLIFIGVNVGYTGLLNYYWWRSEKIGDNLMKTIPDQPEKIVLLLTVPESYKGIPMVGTDWGNEVKLWHNLLVQPPLKGPVMEVYSFNMNGSKDGAHVNVENDSTLLVALNQDATWLWFNCIGASNYENEYYRTEIKGSWGYEITLKRKMDDYILLFQNGNSWKKVNPAIKVESQY
ncbi:hypothetical protein [Taibaiella soli]|uniref:Glycosyltransferase RgtA/B/C/D-like domain-containing protein n=1 Tax=Taibaiella soli TaxID=1649169 RepID=A0A2W2B1D6_9BACT|nr:hypothetical protein [Taibaiella soli]PZF73808.1 hypothetical protein DN068_05555 [Taibaiella soli]